MGVYVGPRLNFFSLSFNQQMYVISRQRELNLLRFRMPKLPSPRDYDDFEEDNALRVPFIIACCTLILFLLIKIIKEWCGGGAPMQLQIVLQDDRTVQNAQKTVQKRNHTVKVWVICIFNLILHRYNHYFLEYTNEFHSLSFVRIKVLNWFSGVYSNTNQTCIP